MTKGDGRFPIHPVYAAAFELRKKAPPIDTISVEQLRAYADKRLEQANIPLPEVLVEDRMIDSGDKQIELTLLRPPGTEGQVLPVLIYLHGGGWVFGSKHTHAKVIRDLCIKAHVAVIFVDYSLSPEHQFPVALEDCYNALQWVVANAEAIKVNADQIAVGGDSAGGNLSTTLSLLAKERGQNHLIKTQIMVYPATAPSHAEYESYELFGQGDYALSMREIKHFGGAYFPVPPPELNNKLATPMLATLEELKGLPPAVVITAESDVLRDEGEAYARRLTEAGVPVAAMRMIGAVHGYITIPVETPVYKQTIALISQHINDTYSSA